MIIDNKCECFACNIPSLDTIKIKKHNGKFVQEDSVVFNCLSANIKVENLQNNHSVIAIKDNAIIERPIQIINLLDKENHADEEEKIDIIVGENSKITILYCDDTLPKTTSNTLHNINVELKHCSQMAFYKMENVNNQTSIASNIVFNLTNDVHLQTFFITLNGGKLTNNIRVNFNSKHSFADLNGLYLMDREQSVENIVKVFHYKDDCKSTQLFKGILDDEARANFVGHVLVDYYAKNNEARQTNNNILLTDKAKVNTRPVLEIYNDDVQCSHGATTGQLDENALYYLKTRGISDKQAKMLLMNAFCQSVLLKSEIKELQEGLTSLIQKRLEGELSMENPFKIQL